MLVNLVCTCAECGKSFVQTVESWPVSAFAWPRGTPGIDAFVVVAICPHCQYTGESLIKKP